MRIVSLVPSITETLFDFGLEEHIVGISRFCVHPENKVKNIAKIGGTKNINVEKTIALKPTLVIANKEENTKEQVEALQKEVPVWVTDIYSLQTALDFLNELGQRTSTEEIASQRIRDIHSAILNQTKYPMRSALYFIWQKPWMVAGESTFISEMMKIAGFSNAAKMISGRYPEITESEIKRLNADIILLSSEPYPFDSKHLEAVSQAYPMSDVKLVDGEMFSWYGSRIKIALKYFEELRLSFQKE